MKKKTRITLFAAFIITGIFATIIACTKKSNPCNGITCYNLGSCDNGICSCFTGWSGTNCQIAYNTVYGGNWTGTACNSNTSISITPSTATPLNFTMAVPTNLIAFQPCTGSPSTVNVVCLIAVNLQGFTSDTTSYNDGCGDTYLIYASGSIASGTLTTTITVNLTNNLPYVKSCTFTGTN